MSDTKDVYVYSTLTATNVYTEYLPGGGDMPIPGRSVTIFGGSNIPNKQLLTSHGVLTRISQEDLSWLATEETFKLHMANGFITISEHKVDPEKAAADMKGRDQSAPLVEEDFEEGQAPVEEKPAPKGKNSRRA